MNIYLIRHGETDWNVMGKLQGREDIPLNDNGRKQAKECAKALQGAAAQAVFTSPLLRARQTAVIMAEVLNIQKIYEDEGLIERDYGKASGLLPEERRARFPDGNYEGIEAWEILKNRMLKAVQAAAGQCFPKPIIIISHGSAINAVLAALSNHDIGTGKTRLKNACINMLAYDGQSLKLETYNQTANEFRTEPPC